MVGRGNGPPPPPRQPPPAARPEAREQRAVAPATRDQRPATGDGAWRGGHHGRGGNGGGWARYDAGYGADTAMTMAMAEDRVIMTVTELMEMIGTGGHHPTTTTGATKEISGRPAGAVVVILLDRQATSSREQ